jgi:RIO-like serine/threonine protein kinase
MTGVNFPASASTFVENSIPPSPTDLATQQCTELLQNFDVVEGDFLICKESRAETLTSLSTLHTVVNVFLSHQGDFETFKTGNLLFIGRSLNGKVELIKMGDKIDVQSLFADIYNVICFNSGRERAFKSLRPVKGVFQNEKNKKYIEHEFKRIQEVNAATKQGVIDAIKFLAVSSFKYYGYLMTKCSSDYFTLIEKEIGSNKVTFKDRIEDFYQLLLLLKIMQEKGWVHRDLKPENILVKTVDQFRFLYVTDWTSCLSKEDLDNKKLVSSMHCYLPWDEYAKAVVLEESTMPGMKGESTEVIAAWNRLDLFSMGGVLFSALTGLYAYPLQGQWLLLKKDELHRFPKEVAPKEISDLILEMIDGNPTKRPTAAEAFTRYEAFIKTDYPEIYLNIQKRLNLVAAENPEVEKKEKEC